MKLLLRKLLHFVRCILILIVFFLSIPLAFLIYKKRKIWLISEIDFDARDNGFAFFQFLRKECRNINASYLITKNNPQFNIVKRNAVVIKPFSYRHMLIFISAKVRISTLVHGCSPSYYVTKYVLKKHHFFGKNVALKHGIFKNLHPNYYKENAHLDLICCGTKQEFDFINNHFHYEKGVAQLTGLARFDGLYDFNVENQILIMPTWRRWLDNISNPDEFVESEFYKKWMSFLQNNDLNNLASVNSIQFVFFLHPKLSKFADCFKNSLPHVLFLDKNDELIQNILKKAKLLITDYSSVYFDFAYMRKPIVYYQFDEDMFYRLHYSKGYFDYRVDGFGDVCVDCESAVKSVIKIVNGNYSVDEKYLKLSNSSFVFKDNNNSRRIFNAIVEMIK